MRRYKRIISITLIIVISLFTFFWICGYPIVIKTGKAKVSLDTKYAEIFNPFENYNINEGEWIVYLKIDSYDFNNLNPSIQQYKLLSLSSVKMLQQVKETWTFKRTGGDVATVSSSMIIVRNGENVFECGIVIDKDMIGLQSKEFGWAEPVAKEKFIESLKGFKKVYSPFVII